MDDQERKARAAEANRRYREKQKAAGLKRVLTDVERVRQREYNRAKRAEARAAGIKLPSDTWHERNPEKHRARIKRWRSDNIEYARVLDAEAQERRRSTPWGRITNRMWPIVHFSVRRGSSKMTRYTDALGYTWADLRSHLEAQFTGDMSWETWGSVWELDHIKPLSTFRYTSLEDPLFAECWALSNLRPLLREENSSKGSKSA